MGLEVVIFVVNKIVLGQIDVGIVGGMDIIFDVFVGFNEKMCKILLEVNCVKFIGVCVKVLVGLWLLMFVCFLLLCNSELCIGLLMGEYCELMVKCWGICCEDQDVLVLCSYYNFMVVYECGFFIDLMIVYLGFDCDNNLCGNLIFE